MAYPKPHVARHYTPNYASGRGGYLPRGIVIHIGEGYDFRGHFGNPNSDVSSHFVVYKDGRIDQFVNESDTAYAAGLKWDSARGVWLTPDKTGRSANPSWRLLQTGVNPNLYTLHIENAGFTGEPWTAAMYNANADICAYLCDKYSMPADRLHIIGHYEINRTDRARCPGGGVNLDTLVAMVRERLAPVPVPTEEPDYRIKYIELYGVTDRHRKTLEYIRDKSASNEDARERAAAALAGRWRED
jgi:N-acetylmuramoyl-L-alanine amidase